MNKFKLLMPVLMAGFLFALPRLALAVCFEGCEPPPSLTCPQSPGECQVHYGPATLKFGGQHQISYLDFSQAYIDGDDLGDPTYIGGTDYQVCVYQGEGLLAQWGAPAGPSYSFIDKVSAKGIRFVLHANLVKQAATQETVGPLQGLFNMKYLLAKPDTSIQIQRTLKEVRRPPNGRLYSTGYVSPSLPLPNDVVTAAFVNSNTCWSTTFGPEDIVRNKPNSFVMKRKLLNKPG